MRAKLRHSQINKSWGNVFTRPTLQEIRKGALQSEMKRLDNNAKQYEEIKISIKVNIWTSLKNIIISIVTMVCSSTFFFSTWFKRLMHFKKISPLYFWAHSVLRCNFVTAATKNGGNSAVKGKSFCILLKVSWYKFKLECYNFRMINVIPMVATKKWL